MKQEFAVVLLDVKMPGMDGFETAELIHDHPRFETIPIIFVTGVHVTEFDRLKGYKAGAIDYVYIPVIPEILRSKVAVLVELYGKRRELQAREQGARGVQQAARGGQQLAATREDARARGAQRPSAARQRGAVALREHAQGSGGQARRIPRHVVARAAQSAVAAAQCLAHAHAGRHAGPEDHLVARRHRAAAQAPDPAGGRSARRVAHRARQDRAGLRTRERGGHRGRGGGDRAAAARTEEAASRIERRFAGPVRARRSGAPLAGGGKPAAQRRQVHRRGWAHRARHPRERTARPRSACATAASASQRIPCRTSSSCSRRFPANASTPAAVWASASRWCARWSSCTAARSVPPARASTGAASSPCDCRCSRARRWRATQPKLPHREKRPFRCAAIS